MDTRDEELQRTPLTRADPATWPRGVRSISIDETDRIGVDRSGRLYWDGRAVEIREFKLRWPERTIAIAAVVIALAATIQGWQWGCELTWINGDWCPPKGG